MAQRHKTLPTWILIVSGLVALMELMVSVFIWISPESVIETLDLNANGIDYLVGMWATRQFALGFIFLFATIRRSVPMLVLAFIFFLVMFLGDGFIGFTQNDNGLILSALIMCILSSLMLFKLNKLK